METLLVLACGLVLLGASLVALSLLTAASGYFPFLAGLLLAGFGLGLTGPVGTTAITASLPADQQGVASAANDATREIGAALGVALMGSVFGNRYRSSLTLDLGALPEAATDAVRRSPVGGLYVAGRLGPRGAALAEDVRNAFMSGMSASVLAVAVVTAAAVCALAGGRRRRKPGGARTGRGRRAHAGAARRCGKVGKTVARS